MATTVHQITCADEHCREFGITANYRHLDIEVVATRHRLALAKDGWTDFEGRDYCPDHTPDDEAGMCPACDTTPIERCIACGSCRCDRHDTCTPPAA